MSIEVDSKCFGCGICVYICPTKAIVLKENEKGYVYPHIDKHKCIECGKCDKFCTKNEKLQKTFPKEMYAIKNKDKDIRFKSTSGGVFYEIAKSVILKKGIVYGCLIDDENKVKHSRAENIDSLNNFMGSKYVQSDLNDIFQMLVKDINEDKIVLFSGTPCQCYAIKRMLENKHCDLGKLILCDFLCHGVPSASFFKNWINFIEKKYKGKVECYKFRDKGKLKNPPDPRGIRFNIVKNKKTKDIYNIDINDLFFDMFLGNYILRESCYSCNYIGFDRVSDFTLADYWGCENHYASFFDTNGISLLFVNTENGQNIYEMIKHRFDYVNVKANNTLQKPLVKAAKKPEDYDKFWLIYLKKGANRAFLYRKKCITKKKIVSKAKSVIKYVLPRKIVKNLVNSRKK